MSRLEDKMRHAMKMEVVNGRLDPMHGALAATEAACEYFNREDAGELTALEESQVHVWFNRLLIEINEGRIDRPMARFRKKPVEVEAIKFLELIGEGTPKFEGAPPAWLAEAFCKTWDDLGKVGTIDVPMRIGEGKEPLSLYIGTLEGAMRVSPGDWVVRGTQGELYPCKPQMFEDSYEYIGDHDVDAGVQRLMDAVKEQDDGTEQPSVPAPTGEDGGSGGPPLCGL